MKKYGASVILVVILLAAWEIGARIVNYPFILPTPTGILTKLWELRMDLLFKHLPATLSIVVIGLIISVVLGVMLAVWMNWSPLIERAFYPLIIASQMIPTIAIAPVFVLWFGYSIWSKVIVTVLITFFLLRLAHLMGFARPTKS